MDRFIDKFITYLEVEKNYSRHTTLNYSVDLREFSEFTGSTVLEKIDYLFLRRFLAHLRTKEYLPRTLTRKLSTLRSFFKFLHREGHIKNNPATLLMSPKREKLLPKFLTEEEAAQFIEMPVGDKTAEGDGPDGRLDLEPLEGGDELGPVGAPGLPDALG